jgi:hypothetical protein
LVDNVHQGPPPGPHHVIFDVSAVQAAGHGNPLERVEQIVEMFQYRQAAASPAVHG